MATCLHLCCLFCAAAAHGHEAPSPTPPPGWPWPQPPPPAGGRISVDTSRGGLVDEDGRERIFHGTNVVYKGFPYAPPMFPIDTNSSFGEADMDQIAAWGMNNVRLGLMWAGAEPERDLYNYTYLARLREIVDALGKRGIYTYVELHQDALGERFCGNGVPTWLTEIANGTGRADTFPEPLSGYGRYAVNKSDGLPSEADCNRHLWANYYGTKAVGAAFQMMYDNTFGLGDRVALLWAEVAKVFKSSTWLLGYELMNEPWAGDHWQNPSIVYPGVADRVNLAPFYERLVAAIQVVDVDHLIMYEPIPWNNYANSGFVESPTGAAYANKSVFAYHYYHPPDLMSPASYMFYRTRDAKRLASAGFMTEFSASWNVPDSSAPAHSLKSTLEVITAAENYTQSWSGWQYKVFHPATGRHPMTPGDMSMFHPDGTLDTGIVSAVSQPYARAIAGTIQYNKFTEAKHGIWPFGSRSSYVLEYNARASCQLPTEIYLNEAMHFPGGISVTVTPPNVAKAVYDAKAKLVHVTHESSLLDGMLVSIQIESKNDLGQQEAQNKIVV